MELMEAMKLRGSIRGYNSDPVPREMLQKILEAAVRAPSGDNVQPWEFTILGGEKLKELSAVMEEQFLAGEKQNHDFPLETFDVNHKSRQIELAKSVFGLMEIAREDKDKRRQWMSKMIRFFDAPNAIIISIDQFPANTGGHYFIFSVAMMCQNILLAALEFDLGTCVTLAAVGYPKVLKEVLGMPDSKKIAIGLSIGYPDWHFPANKLRTSRESIDDISTWYDVP